MFRFYWDLISLAFLIVTMVVIPVGIAFFNEAMTTVAGWMFFNLSLDSWFLIDIIINFRTGIVKVSIHLNVENVRIRSKGFYFHAHFVTKNDLTVSFNYPL